MAKAITTRAVAMGIAYSLMKVFKIFTVQES
jgi:hypothetical protein